MIAILAIPVALVAIISKIIVHLKYMNLMSSEDASDFFGALSPTFFIRDKNLEQSNGELQKLAKKIKTRLIIFYVCIALFFISVSF